MAKRKRLSPAAFTSDGPVSAPKKKAMRAPIADVAGDASTAAALLELSDRINTARQEGRWIEKISIDAIKSDYLVRDRVEIDDDEMTALKDSLRSNGQQAAIEVVPHGPETFGLISGWRRLTALRELYLEGGLGTVLAIVRQPDNAAESYLAMVQENEIRAGLSFYERGRIVVRAVDEGAFASDKEALARLFHAAPRAKRSKIGSFVRIVRALDGTLQFPTALSEKSGLALAQALDAEAWVATRLREKLEEVRPQTAIAEMAVIVATIKGPNVPTSKPASIALMDGLDCVTYPDGRIVLQGNALRDNAFVERIMVALRVIK